MAVSVACVLGVGHRYVGHIGLIMPNPAHGLPLYYPGSHSLDDRGLHNKCSNPPKLFSPASSIALAFHCGSLEEVQYPLYSDHQLVRFCLAA